ncbi:hypothetical protein [uncultured Kordia sp.]|uniref:hypothetical protein n=1 Tax=uncultured Kordia sp. TaxID=507699 RepID=UPI002632CCA7|nr:hypothetical protein [uncultured Kordia sp.]
MKKSILIILLTCIAIVSCDSKKQVKTEKETKVEIAPELIKNLKVDHFNLWTKKPEEFKKKLVKAGFTVIPDSLRPPHVGQGTQGKYINFLNMYFEIISVYDEEELMANQKQNPLLDFETRKNYEKNGASPFSISLQMKAYDASKIPFETVKYHQSWMSSDSVNIESAKSSKTNFSEPSVFVVYPEISSDDFATIEDLVKIPEEYAMWREFFKHSNGAKRVTNMKVHMVRKHEVSDVIPVLNGIEGLQIIDDTSHFIEVDFDHKIQNIKLDFRPDFPVIINL